MHLSRTAQVIALMIVWAATLVGVDKVLNHAPPRVNSVSGQGKPQIVITFIHFCCSGCYDKMFSAAKSMSWIVTASTDQSDLKKPEDMEKAKIAESEPFETEYNKDATLLLDETDLKSVDLVKLSTEFRNAGLVPGRTILENIPHFRLVAVDPHLCCGVCEASGIPP